MNPLTNRLPRRALALLGGLCCTIAAAPLAAATDAVATRCCAIVELRQYTLHPQHFAPFARMFEDEFLEPLDAAGMTVIGQFRDLDDPNRFVWMRGFADMPRRAAALSAFYDGALWKSRRDAANAHFTDTDNVLLLHPVLGAGIAPGAPRPAGAAAADSLIVATVYLLRADAAAEFPRWFAAHVLPALAQAGISVDATFETETAANTFPRLPVREGEHAFVWVAHFAQRERGDAALQALAGQAHWHDEIEPALQRQLQGATQVLRLQPLPRSRLR
jgi:hypothetical protein